MIQSLTVDQRIRQLGLRLAVDLVAKGNQAATDDALLQLAERFSNYIRTGQI